MTKCSINNEEKEFAIRHSHYCHWRLCKTGNEI